MSRWIRRATRARSLSRTLSFDYPGRPGSGFAFPCDADGKVDVASLPPIAVENYVACVTGRVQVEPAYVQTFEGSDVTPGAIRCDCGAVLAMWPASDVGCDACGAEYNSAGQRLAPRCQWGEETGETAADLCVGGDW